MTSEVMLLLSVLVLMIMAIRAPSRAVRRADRVRDGPALEVPDVVDVTLVVTLQIADGVADPGVSGDVNDSLRIPNGVTGTTNCQWRQRWPSLMCSKLDNLIKVAYPIHLLHPEGSVVKGHQRDFFSRAALYTTSAASPPERGRSRRRLPPRPLRRLLLPRPPRPRGCPRAPTLAWGWPPTRSSPARPAASRRAPPLPRRRRT